MRTLLGLICPDLIVVIITLPCQLFPLSLAWEWPFKNKMEFTLMQNPEFSTPRKVSKVRIALVDVCFFSFFFIDLVLGYAFLKHSLSEILLTFAYCSFNVFFSFSLVSPIPIMVISWLNANWSITFILPDPPNKQIGSTFLPPSNCLNGVSILISAISYSNNWNKIPFSYAAEK